MYEYKNEIYLKIQERLRNIGLKHGSLYCAPCILVFECPAYTAYRKVNHDSGATIVKLRLIVYIVMNITSLLLLIVVYLL